MDNMKTYIFFRDTGWYPIQEVSDEKVLAHIPLNPGTRKVETVDGRVLWQETKQ